MSTTENDGTYQKKLHFYTNTRLGRASFWAKNHPGDMTFVSGLVMMGIAVSLIFAIGGTAGVVGLFLVLVAGLLLCGKAIFPESGNESLPLKM